MARVFLKVPDIATRWDCSEWLVREVLASGAVPGVLRLGKGRLIRISEDSLVAYEHSMSDGASGPGGGADDAAASAATAR